MGFVRYIVCGIIVKVDYWIETGNVLFWICTTIGVVFALWLLWGILKRMEDQDA